MNTSVVYFSLVLVKYTISAEVSNLIWKGQCSALQDLIDKEKCSCYAISYRSFSTWIFFLFILGGKQKCCIQKNILNLRKQRHSAWKQPTTDSRQHKQLKGEPKLPESHVCDLNIESIWQLLRKNIPG